MLKCMSWIKTGQEIAELAGKAKEHQYYLSPNVYLKLENQKYEPPCGSDRTAGSWMSQKWSIFAQAEQFYEQDYYAPSDDGFKVF